MNDRKGPERRKHVRVSRRFVIQYHIVGQEGSWGASTIMDLSMGGCSFGTTIAFSPGDRLLLEIKFPGSPVPLECEGNVVRCTPAPDGKFYFVGLSFINLTEEKTASLKEVVDFLIKLQKK